MAAQRWQLVKDILQSALELTGEDRAAFLDKTCVDNQALRTEVESLIVHHKQAEDFLKSPLVELPANLFANEPAPHSNGSIDQDTVRTQQPNFIAQNFGGDPLIGRTLGEFTILDKIGEGGFGSVYRAEQFTLGREAVVKVLRAMHRGNKEIIERFMREARLASRLEHPYTAHVYAFGAELDGLMWIAMEYVHGVPLDRLLLTQGPIPLEQFVPLLDKICEVVHTAHEYGIIHRDLKPANVMAIERAGRLLPKLLDFGIAKNINQENYYNEASTCSSEYAEAVTQNHKDKLSTENASENKNLHAPNSLYQIQTAGIIGSTAYMAPEQWENPASADARADIYALGMLAYEAIVGRPAFEGSFASLAEAHSSKTVPPLGPSFPAALDGVIAKAAAKRPEERYSTAIEFAAAFSPEGNRIVTASADNTVKVWNASDGKLLISLDGHKDAVDSAAFSSDGARIVTASADKTVKVWDAASGKLLASFENHTSSTVSAVFSPDGNRIVMPGYTSDPKIIDARLETRSSKEIAEIVKQRVPFRLEQGRLIPIR